MKYLIKSLKWTKCNGYETWYGPNRNGYTSLVCEAGIYTEEDRTNMTTLENERTIIFIPISPMLIKKATRQVNTRINNLDKHLSICQKRYAKEVNETYETIKRLSDKSTAFIKLAEQRSEGVAEKSNSGTED